MNARRQEFNAGFGRRALLCGVSALFLTPAARANVANWTTFKQRFLADEGRIVDNGNKGVSHSEGQGWGMLFAESHGDRATFEQLWDWTRKSLRRDDGLFSWRWMPGVSNPVSDRNDAADGDLMIAWALARAARRWNEPQWAAQSGFITAAILNHLAAEIDGRLILLPGIDGFRQKHEATINLSYYVWPAIEEFAKTTADRRWRRLANDGLWLLDNAAFGTHALPPDWLAVGPGGRRIAKDWPPQFGYEAVRIPLYLAWNGDRARLGRFIAAWQSSLVGGRPPAFIDLETGALAGYTASGGFASVLELAQLAVNSTPGDVPSAALSDEDDYYAASLKMLSALAATEVFTPR